jgi:hypothetical protein
MNDEYLSGSYYQNSFSKEQNQNFAVEFDQITRKMLVVLDAGESYSSAAMQDVVREYYNWILQFWTPDRETFKSLAMSYVLPTGYRDTYEGYREGLGKFVYDGICHFADNEL